MCVSWYFLDSRTPSWWMLNTTCIRNTKHIQTSPDFQKSRKWRLYEKQKKNIFGKLTFQSVKNCCKTTKASLIVSLCVTHVGPSKDPGQMIKPKAKSICTKSRMPKAGVTSESRDKDGCTPNSVPHGIYCVL